MITSNWSSVTIEALQNLWQGFIDFIPELIGALVVFILGWIISHWVGRLIGGILRKVKFDKVFEKTRLDEAMEKAEMKMKMSDFIGSIIKWVLMIVFLLASVQILGLGAFTNFLEDIVSWLPSLVVSVAIFVVAVIISDFSDKVVRALVSKMGSGYAKFSGRVVKISVWVFAVLAILSELGVASEIVQIIVSGFVALVVISCGLAFGLGGKELAKEILTDCRNKMKK